MLVKLKRNFVHDGVRYRARSDGVAINDGIELPPDAEIWDGKNWVPVPTKAKEREPGVVREEVTTLKAVEAPEGKVADMDAVQAIVDGAKGGPLPDDGVFDGKQSGAPQKLGPHPQTKSGLPPDGNPTPPSDATGATQMPDKVLKAGEDPALAKELHEKGTSKKKHDL